ncbi:MAG TPA: hypothetical protein EYN06_02095 [Myxococcales bacterium]|nr:hypothetical protein [Myxococcales bacterium]HIN85242.1 hypothetical protein [Myxococcales bacterium]
MSTFTGFAVNVDVDSLGLYYGIHGLNQVPGEAAWELGVPRFLDLFSHLGLRATFFVVAKDLEREIPLRVAQEVVAAGHELASHSYSHPYDLIQQSDAEIEAQIAKSEEIIGGVRGTRLVGFRAPGYNTNESVAQILVRRGYRYDSSLFPCPPYYLTRAAILGAMSLIGKQSASIVGDVGAAFSNPLPHIQEVGDGALLEFPISVVPGIRFPIIGTALTLLGQTGIRLLIPALRRMPFINLEFHALDLLDNDDPIHPSLIRRQRDLRTRVETKREIFSRVLKVCNEQNNNDTLEGFSADRG